MRQLATIQKIVALHQIPGADAIEMAQVLGWELVVKKNQFKIGDVCVYVEIDSILPVAFEPFAFLQGKRIKTVKLRGQISQGIAFPIDILPKIVPTPDSAPDWLIGDDVTALLGVTKWEPQEAGGSCNPGHSAGTFPAYIPKTDETRVQVLQHVLDQFKGTLCYVTEKLDGSSVTIWRKDGVLRVASRNFEKKDGPMFDAAQKINVPEGFCFQGEFIGMGVQKNKYKLTEHQIRIFSYFDINEQKYVIATPTVPMIDANYILGDSIPDLVKLSIGQSQINPAVKREGIVIRSYKNIDGIASRHFFSGGRLNNAMGLLSFKVINPEFSLRYDE